MLSYFKNLFKKKELYCCNEFCESPLITGDIYYDELTNEIYNTLNCEEAKKAASHYRFNPFHGRLPIISRKNALELLAQGKIKQPSKFKK